MMRFKRIDLIGPDTVINLKLITGQRRIQENTSPRGVVQLSPRYGNVNTLFR